MLCSLRSILYFNLFSLIQCSIFISVFYVSFLSIFVQTATLLLTLGQSRACRGH